MVDEKIRPTKLLWLDMEMTGLDPKKNVIIEVAAKVTDFGFKALGEFHAVVYQPASALEAANDWSREHFTVSGLFDQVRTSQQSSKAVANLFAAFIHEQFKGEPAIIAGNSVHQDRAFIKQWWPEVDALLHFRMFDVTTFKILFWGATNTPYEKRHDHRGDSDIEESIDELRFYLSQLMWPPKAASQS